MFHIFGPKILLFAVSYWQNLTVFAIQMLTFNRVSPLLCILRHGHKSRRFFVQCFFNSIIGADSCLTLVVQVLTATIDEDLAVDLRNCVVDNVLSGLLLPLLFGIFVVLRN